MSTKWRLIPQFSVRCSSLSVENLLAFEDKALFAVIDQILKLRSDTASMAEQLLGHFRRDRRQIGAEFGRIAGKVFSSVALAGDTYSEASLKKLVKAPIFQSDPRALRFSRILDELIVAEQKATALAESSYRQLDEQLKSVVNQEKFRRSIHPHPFALAGYSMLRTDPEWILGTQRLETRHKLSLLKLVLRMTGRNDSTRALGKLISGRVGEVSGVAQNLGTDERYYLLLDRNLVKRMLLRLRFAGAGLNYVVDSIPHSIEFFKVTAAVVAEKHRGNRFFEELSAQLQRSYELAVQYEGASDNRTKRETFGNLLSALVDIDSNLATHTSSPYVLHVNIGRILTRLERLVSKRLSESVNGHGIARGGVSHSILQLVSQFAWDHFGTQDVWQKLTEKSLATWLLGLDWLTGQVEISQEIARNIENALGLSLNLIESFSELATLRLAELAKNGASFHSAFQAAITYALEAASIEGARKAQAVYNVSDVMLSGTPQDIDRGKYEIVISDLNVRGHFVERPDELYSSSERSICGMLAKHLLAFFDGQDKIDFVYGGLVPSGITQLTTYSIERALARSGRTLNVKSIRSFAETMRLFLISLVFPLIRLMPRTSERKPKGLWYLLDDEYRSAANFLVGVRGDLQTVRLYDSYFFLHALASKDEILDRLLSRIPNAVRGSVRIRFRHHYRLPIDDALACFKPIGRKMTLGRLVQSLLMVRDLKARHGLASRVYVKGLGKPVLISLDSLPCILLLRNLLTNWKRMGLSIVKMSNMDPPSEKLWLRDTDGLHTAEFRIAMVRQRT